MKYEFELLKAGDADIIIICHHTAQEDFIILIDAGNYNNGKRIKKHLKEKYNTSYIDLAICTHPDDDHKGGFFYLLNDDDIEIEEFWLTDPADFLTEADIKYYRNEENARKAVRQIWENASDTSENLIDLIDDNCSFWKSVIAGDKHETLPIKIVAPNANYYGEVVKQMVEDYGVEAYEESDTEKYDSAAVVEEKDAKSIIDTTHDDPSPYNKSSLVVLYEPNASNRCLVAGDASRASLVQMLKDYTELKNGVYKFKVPHHGSRHNLTTEIIDNLKPTTSYISAAGTRKHPNNSVVYWLSKYGSVYSTHTCTSYIHSYIGMKGRSGDVSIDPLKKKQ